VVKEHGIMSLENAKTFLKKVETDHDLYKKLARMEGDSAAAAKLANELGFTLTADDLIAANEELHGDLSDDELESAAGGLGGKYPPRVFTPPAP